MPLFSSKFSPKKTPSRKSESTRTEGSVGLGAPGKLSLDIVPVRLRLGEQEAVFHDGEWIPESGPVSGKHKENQRLQHLVQQLQEENNMLKLKTEILLDMLTQTTAESHLQERELEKLKSTSAGQLPSWRK